MPGDLGGSFGYLLVQNRAFKACIRSEIANNHEPVPNQHREMNSVPKHWFVCE
jgi:hypothetical protein